MKSFNLIIHASTFFASLSLPRSRKIEHIMKSSSSSSVFQDKIHSSRRKGWQEMGRGGLLPFLLSFSLIIFTSFIFFSLDPFTDSINPPKIDLVRPNIFVPQSPNTKIKKYEDEERKCDLFKGHWVPDMKGSLYTNSTCPTMPISKNCFMNGRKDADFLNWRWKPDGCEIERFDPKAFLGILKGKKLAFVGDSVARNHMESLLCALSQEETPVDKYKDSEDRFRTWYFPSHDFTIMVLWTKFLVAEDEIIINGSSSGVFNLHFDRVDENWSRKIAGIDYAIVSSAHWFFRKLYLYDDRKLVGCVYCDDQNVTNRGIDYALGMAFRRALKYINSCKECKDMVTLLRTFSPAHFENGAWNTGGTCNRTSPYSEREVRKWTSNSDEWKYRTAQVKEISRATGRRRGKKFRVLDVTKAMLMRPDGHPGSHWDNQYMRGYNDCVHWCLPGPIDIWNDFLLAVIRREAFP